MIIQKKNLRKTFLQIMHLKLYKLYVLIPIEREQPSDEILHETNPNWRSNSGAKIALSCRA